MRTDTVVQPQVGTAECETDAALEHIESLISQVESARRGRSGPYLPQLLHIALWEICNLPQRIRNRCKKESSDLDAGNLYLRTTDGRSVLNIRAHGRIECIEKVAAKHPWTSSADWGISLEAWDQGVEWAVRTLGSGSALSDEHKALLASELTYKSPLSILPTRASTR
jgi:hypothetical protein